MIDPFCISPTLFDRIKFWGELRQELNRDTILSTEGREERGHIYEVQLIE